MPYKLNQNKLFTVLHIRQVILQHDMFYMVADEISSCAHFQFSHTYSEQSFSHLHSYKQPEASLYTHHINIKFNSAH